jgi:hypothetical protein
MPNVCSRLPPPPRSLFVAACPSIGVASLCPLDPDMLVTLLRWQPLLEHDGMGVITAQTHTTPFLQKARPYAMSRAEFAKKTAAGPWKKSQGDGPLLKSTMDVITTSATLTDKCVVQVP